MSAHPLPPPKRQSPADEYIFQNGVPTLETAERIYAGLDLNRAVEAYRFFYPTVSGSAIFKGTDQNKAALRSLFELKGKSNTSYLDLHFGSIAPAGHEDVWIKTISGKGWFTYFRIYGPTEAAFKGSWKPGDFEEVQ